MPSSTSNSRTGWSGPAGDRLAELDEITGYHLDQARTYRLALGPDDERTRALALRAGRRLAAAGRRSAERDELPTAMRLLAQAEALLVEDPAARFDALILLLKVCVTDDYSASMQVALRAEAVAQGLDELTVRRARLWGAGVRAFVDPAFNLSEIRAEAEAVARAFESAGDIDALLDIYEVLIVIDLNAAHWLDLMASARVGLELATKSGREGRRDDFADWLANSVVWGSTDAAEGLVTMQGLLASTTRRLLRASWLSGMAFLHGVLGDERGAEAAQLAAASIWDELGHGRSEFRHAYTRFALDDFPAALRLTREVAADLERRGDSGQRSTMVGLEAWMLALTGDDDGAARAADESRRLGASDDAVTQILWRSAFCVVLARRGETAEADRVSTEAVDIADQTDAFDAGSAWLARAQVLSILGRREEATDAARRARDLYAMKGFVNGIRRAEALIGR